MRRLQVSVCCLHPVFEVNPCGCTMLASAAVVAPSLLLLLLVLLLLFMYLLLFTLLEVLFLPYLDKASSLVNKSWTYAGHTCLRVRLCRDVSQLETLV